MDGWQKKTKYTQVENVYSIVVDCTCGKLSCCCCCCFPPPSRHEWMFFPSNVSVLMQVEKDVALDDILTVRFRSVANDSLYFCCFSPTLPCLPSLELEHLHPISAQQAGDRERERWREGNCCLAVCSSSTETVELVRGERGKRITGKVAMSFDLRIGWRLIIEHRDQGASCHLRGDREGERGRAGAAGASCEQSAPVR